MISLGSCYDFNGDCIGGIKLVSRSQTAFSSFIFGRDIRDEGKEQTEEKLCPVGYTLSGARAYKVVESSAVTSRTKD